MIYNYVPGDSYLVMVIHDELNEVFSRVGTIHIDRMLDDVGFAVTGGSMLVDVLPPGTDPDRPAAYATICEENLSAEQARVVAALLLVAAEYMEFLTMEAAGNG